MLRLPTIIGEEKAKELSEIAKTSQNNYKWDREELKEIRKYYRNKIKEI